MSGAKRNDRYFIYFISLLFERYFVKYRGYVLTVVSPVYFIASGRSVIPASIREPTCAAANPSVLCSSSVLRGRDSRWIVSTTRSAKEQNTRWHMSPLKISLVSIANVTSTAKYRILLFHFTFNIMLDVNYRYGNGTSNNCQTNWDLRDKEDIDYRPWARIIVTFIEERKFHVGGKRSQKMKKTTKYGVWGKQIVSEVGIRRGLDGKLNQIFSLFPCNSSSSKANDLSMQT